MIKQRFNAAWLFLLITAFLVAQWAPLHAHLNAQHSHDGERHQHSVGVHAHQPVVFQADQIDSGHLQEDEDQIVDLEHDQSPPDGKKLGDQSVALAAFVNFSSLIQIGEVGSLVSRNSLPHLLHPHHDQRPGQPRAPPRLS